MTLRERFEAKVGSREDCWLWTGFVSPQGYGMIRASGTPTTAHRVSYELHIGPIPEGDTIDHLCRVRACVNPAHLEAVSNRENILRGVAPTAANAKKTRCPAGHPYNKANTYHRKDRRGRHCRVCQATRLRVARSGT